MHSMDPKVVSAAVALALAGFANAELITDTVFNDADWTVHQSTFYNPGSSSASSQAVGQGLTGSARFVGNSVAGLLSGIYGINILTSQGWDGSGPLTDLSMTVSARGAFGLQAYGFALEQGGKYWIASYYLTTGFFETRTLSLTATDFTRPFGVDASSQPDNPDFSAGAAPIRFGFYSGNSSSAGGGSYNTGAYYSDFSVSFVPAPGAFALLGAAGLIGRRRR